MHRALLVLAASAAAWALPGCKREVSTEVPAAAHRLTPQSQISPEASRLVELFAARKVVEIHAWMTPELRARLRLDDLEAAAERLFMEFGSPLGVMEEHDHTEGELRWYSGLVVHGTAGGRGQIAPVLYQFALDPAGRLARMLVREHWFWTQVDAPADDYMPITRFHFVGRGEWTVSHGGRTALTNYHHGNRGQRFAYDMVVTKNGLRRKPGANPKDNRSYYCHGEQLLAPAAGTVVRAINDVPENVPGTRGRAGGNGLVIDHGFGEFSALWHAIPGSVRVRVGDRVEPGQVVALAGNSGRSSGPHVHFHVSHPISGPHVFGLPAEFVDVWVDDVWHDRTMPVRGEKVRSGLTPRKTAAMRRRILLDV
jgi:hypothetical protein